MKGFKVAVAGAVLALSASVANAGCLGGAAVGGVAGHFVGNGHAVLGAAGGCAVGHYMAQRKDRRNQQRAQSQRNYNHKNQSYNR